jgi:hypothetical protein
MSRRTRRSGRASSDCAAAVSAGEHRRLWRRSVAHHPFRAVRWRRQHCATDGSPLGRGLFHGVITQSVPLVFGPKYRLAEPAYDSSRPASSRWTRRHAGRCLPRLRINTSTLVMSRPFRRSTLRMSIFLAASSPRWPPSSSSRQLPPARFTSQASKSSSRPANGYARAKTPRRLARREWQVGIPALVINHIQVAARLVVIPPHEVEARRIAVVVVTPRPQYNP